jgi:hypothetical protein
VRVVAAQRHAREQAAASAQVGGCADVHCV